VISQKKDDEVKKTILGSLVDFRSELSKEEDCSPFSIFVYKDLKESIVQRGLLKTKSMAEDINFTMREIDADAVLYSVQRPFSFLVRLSPSNYKLNPLSLSLYKEMDIAGRLFDLDATVMIQSKEDERVLEITLV
jgi:hypothetical protein